MDENKDRKLFTEFAPVTAGQWKQKVVEDLKGADFDKKLLWKPEDGLSFQPFYTADDLEKLYYLNSNPGEFPYTRGTKTHNNNWKIIQEIDETDYVSANKTATDAIKRGAEGIIFNASKLNNYDSFCALLNGIDLNKTFVGFKKAELFSKFIYDYQHYLEKHGYNSNQLNGSFDFDPIGDFAVNGEFYKGEGFSMHEADHIVSRTVDNLSKFKSININGSNFHNAGASAIQELAFSLSCGVQYLDELTKNNIKPEEILEHLQFNFAVGSSYFLEIAKLRAARLLWAKISEMYGYSGKPYINIINSNWNKTIYDPYVNLLRSTTEAMSAAIGCCDSMTILPFNACFKENDAFAERIARNQQIILKEESYFGKVIDPSAGSYYIENLTDSVAAHAWALFLNIEEKGGFVKFVESGELKAEIEKTCQQRDMDIASRKTSVLGTNNYPNSGEMMLDEIAKQNEQFNGKGLKLYRGSQAFEDLRLSTERQFKKEGFRPKVLLLTYGNLAMRKARATFSANFLGCAGYEITPEYNFESVEKSISEIEKRNINIIVICSSDEEYSTSAPEIAKAMKEKFDNKIVIIAGSPKELIDMLKSSGVDEFIHIRSNALAVLKGFNAKFGIE